MRTIIRSKYQGEYFKFILTTMAVACLGLVKAHAVANIWINEIHYDNNSTDVDEGIEIAGVAGTDLTGVRIIFYNGSSGATYDSENLTGLIPDMQNGFGVLNFYVSGLQNGAPDGVALYDAGNSTVIQFLSYEGSFLAVGGPADGLISIDVGVEENGANPSGTSLQLSGAGTKYSDFTWTGPIAFSPDSINSGQSFSRSTATALPDFGSSISLLSVALFALAKLRRPL